MCISTGNFDSIFFLGVTPFLNLEIWRKWKILLKQFVSTTPLKPLNRIALNFVVMKDIMFRYAFFQEMLIWSFWGAIYIPFFVRLPVPYAWNCHSLYIQHSQAMLERGVCELAHSFFHFLITYWSVPGNRGDFMKFWWKNQLVIGVCTDTISENVPGTWKNMYILILDFDKNWYVLNVHLFQS